MTDTKELRSRLSDALAPENGDMWNSGGVAVYGAGNTSELYDVSFKAEGIEPEYYIDNAKAGEGALFCGKPIISYEEAKEKCKNYLVLVSTSNYSTCGNIFDCLRNEPIDGATYMTADEFVFLHHPQEILGVFDRLEDDLSRDTYANLIFARMHRERQRPELTVPNQYFGVPEFFLRGDKEVFVDCGACVGDTIEQYLNVKAGTFGRIYAFEPDKRNYMAMRARVERIEREWAISPERITLINAGVGQKSTKIAMRNASQDIASPGAGFILDRAPDGGDLLPVVTLDEYFVNQRISFLKADIESFEYMMLLGAEEVIKRDKPNISICIYHNPSDMFRIAQELIKLVPEYHLAVRQHLYTLSETVLYAWR